jgi:quinol monooxygenase YgiN
MAKDARQEEGNLQFDLYQSASVPGTFIAVERWATQEAFDAHLQSPSLGAVMGELGPLLTGSIDVHVLVPVT